MSVVELNCCNHWWELTSSKILLQQTCSCCGTNHQDIEEDCFNERASARNVSGLKLLTNDEAWLLHVHAVSSHNRFLVTCIVRCNVLLVAHIASSVSVCLHCHATTRAFMLQFDVVMTLVPTRPWLVAVATM